MRPATMVAMTPDGLRPAGRDGRHRPMRARRFRDCPEAVLLACAGLSLGEHGAVVLNVGEVDSELEAVLQRALASLSGVVSVTSESAHLLVNSKSCLAADAEFHRQLLQAAEKSGVQASVVAFRSSRPALGSVQWSVFTPCAVQALRSRISSIPSQASHSADAVEEPQYLDEKEGPAPHWSFFANYNWMGKDLAQNDDDPAVTSRLQKKRATEEHGGRLSKLVAWRHHELMGA